MNDVALPPEKHALISSYLAETGKKKKAWHKAVRKNMTDIGYLVIPSDFDWDPRVIKSPKYTTEEIVYAGMLYILLANTLEVERITGIPACTIRAWSHNNSWWNDLLIYCKKKVRDQQVANLKAIISISQDELLDRLINGDEVIHPKTGEITRVGVKAQVLSMILSSTIEKQQLLEGSPTSIKVSHSTNALDELLAKLETVGKSKPITYENEEVIDDNL